MRGSHPKRRIVLADMSQSWRNCLVGGGRGDAAHARSIRFGPKGGNAETSHYWARPAMAIHGVRE